MARLNLDPLIKFSDGSQLVVSTQASGEGYFCCELFILRSRYDGQLEFDSVSGQMQRPSSMDAQDFAFGSAQRLYPNMKDGIKKPPYLIWRGPQRQS